MLALCHRDGMKPSRMEPLKINANGWHKDEAFSRRNQDGIFNMGALPLVKAACRLDIKPLISEVIQGLLLLSDFILFSGR